MIKDEISLDYDSIDDQSFRSGAVFQVEVLIRSKMIISIMLSSLYNGINKCTHLDHDHQETETTDDKAYDIG